MIIRKIFPSDKNYMLAEVQLAHRETLLQYLVRYVKDFYQQRYNPLGLIDEVITEIRKEKEYPVEAFDEFYHDLSALYRFKYGEVQLQFLFDGSSHYDKYSREWSDYFKRQVRTFCANKFFIRAVLDIAVFHHKDRVAFLAGNRLKYFLTNYYGVKIYKFKGIMELAS